MSTHSRSMRVIAMSVLVLVSTTMAMAADVDALYAKLGERYAPTVVRIKFVLKVSGGGMFGMTDDQEMESEINGLMIEPNGLVLCSNTQLNGFLTMLQQFMGHDSDISAKPTDIKVLIGDDTEGIEATLLARDTELDLAWIEIKEPPAAPFSFCDIAKSTTPVVGQRLLSVRRMSKFFNRIVAVSEGRIGAITKQPRHLFVPSSDLVAGYGQPVFAEDGTFVGVSVLQTPEPEAAAAGGMGMFSRMGSMQEMMAGLILPAADVVKATERAKLLRESDEEKAETKPAAPASGSDEK